MRVTHVWAVPGHLDTYSNSDFFKTAAKEQCKETPKHLKALDCSPEETRSRSKGATAPCELATRTLHSRLHYYICNPISHILELLLALVQMETDLCAVQIVQGGEHLEHLARARGAPLPSSTQTATLPSYPTDLRTFKAAPRSPHQPENLIAAVFELKV
jgi:hypothetical protein